MAPRTTRRSEAARHQAVQHDPKMDYRSGYRRRGRGCRFSCRPIQI